MCPGVQNYEIYKCCANDNNPTEESLNLPSTKNKFPKQHKCHKPEKAHENNNLTRFGLNAYVLGAMKERSYCFGRRLQCVQHL